ncbi:helix-turn-helix domain-containing protein [Cyclobacterium jeungdonense]|uniref:AraC family transcriptional regulator n=1 Tax=Cyclobacterium jeungdonense TaxID=708087 RepID=A0ABT8CBZ5_9BACT|nr:AraC family transcriptional regulator [Cyclobacterium jeungdonense]MDN3689901.1 AraC family transcriptional regulator [Cyclobacterium jeungdonense]
MVKDISVRSNDRFLDSSLFLYNFFLMVYFLWIEAGYILDMPSMLRVMSPLLYLCAPLFYVYVRNSLEKTRDWRRSDWLHFIPVVIHYLDLIPYFLEPSTFKLENAALAVADPLQIDSIASGWIPIRFHYVFRILLQTGYYSYLLYWIYSLKPRFFQDAFKPNSVNWLAVVMVCMGWVVIFQFSFLVVELLSVFRLATSEGFDSLLRKLSLVGLFFLNVYINFKPNHQFNSIKMGKIPAYRQVDSLLVPVDGAVIGEKVDISSNGNQVSPIKKQIINLLENEKVYLEGGLDLAQFSKLLGIQKNQVSHVINGEFGKRFNELLNQYRINHAIHLIQQGYLDNYTLAALAEQSGFNSRITFFNAFKKEMGTSPSEFWKGFQENIH